MSPNEESGDYDDTVSPKYPTAPGAYLELIPTNSTAAQGQKPLPPVPTACKGDNDGERLYEEMPVYWVQRTIVIAENVITYVLTDI